MQGAPCIMHPGSGCPYRLACSGGCIERKQRAQIAERLKDRPPVADPFGPGIPHLSED